MMREARVGPRRGVRQARCGLSASRPSRRRAALPLPQLLPVDGSLVGRAAKELTLAKISGRTSTAKRVPDRS